MISQKAPLPLIDPDIPITFSSSTPQPSGLSSSWHASSTQKEQQGQHDQQGFGSQFPEASWSPREKREVDESRDNSLEFNCNPSSTENSHAPMHTLSMNGGLTSTCGQFVPPGINSTSKNQSLQQEAFIGWPRAVVVHSELRTETGFAGTLHEASAMTGMFPIFILIAIMLCAREVISHVCGCSMLLT